LGALRYTVSVVRKANDELCPQCVQPLSRVQLRAAAEMSEFGIGP